jgi:BMFP domain-containing protein YqiC
LVLWYLHDVAAQQSEINAEVMRRITSLESNLRQDFKAALDTQVASLDATLRQDFKVALDELAAQTRALSNELTAYSQRSTLPFQILANQVATLADLVGSCLVVLSRDIHSSSIISIVDNIKDQAPPTKEQ